MTETYLSRQEAAAVLDVPLTAVDRLISTGLLPRYRIRERYIRVRQRDVETLLDVPREWLLRC
jgi:excisionase family DNA binding protein